MDWLTAQQYDVELIDGRVNVYWRKEQARTREVWTAYCWMRWTDWHLWTPIAENEGEGDGTHTKEQAMDEEG